MPPARPNRVLFRSSPGKHFVQLRREHVFGVARDPEVMLGATVPCHLSTKRPASRATLERPSAEMWAGRGASARVVAAYQHDGPALEIAEVLAQAGTVMSDTANIFQRPSILVKA